MLNAEQMEAVIKELAEECKRHNVSISDDPCDGCRFHSFCDKFYPGDGATWHWKIEDEEVTL